MAEIRFDAEELRPLIREIAAELAAACQPAEPQTDGLATIEDAVKFLRIGRTKIYSLIEAGEIERVKLDRSIRFKWTDLRNLADRGCSTE